MISLKGEHEFRKKKLIKSKLIRFRKRISEARFNNNLRNLGYEVYYSTIHHRLIREFSGF